MHQKIPMTEQLVAHTVRAICNVCTLSTLAVCVPLRSKIHTNNTLKHLLCLLSEHTLRAKVFMTFPNGYA